MRRILLTALVLGAAALLGAAPVVGARGETGPAEDAIVAIGRSHHGAVLETAALAPGRPAIGEIRVWNDGTVPALFTLSADVRGDGPLAGALRLRIVTDAGRILYDGRFAAFTSASLGTLEPGAGETVRFEATLPDEAAAGLDGLRLAADFRWSATQA